MAFAAALPPWALTIGVALLCAAAWVLPSTRLKLHCAAPGSVCCRAVAAVCPVLGGLVILAAALLRVGLPPLWFSCGAILLIIGLAQPCRDRVRVAAPQRTAARGLSGLVVVLISMVLVEAGVRATATVGRHFGWTVLRADTGVVVAHPRRFYTYAPGSSGTTSFKIDAGRAGHFSYRISRHGLRGAECGPKADDELRVMILGDSYAFGWGLEDNDTIEAALSRILRDACPGKRVSVINAGVWGYSVWQERDLLQETGFALEPDIVVHLLFPANDIDGAWERRKTFPKTHSVEWRRTLQPYMHRDNWRFRVQDAAFRYWHTLALLKRAFPVSLDQPVLELLGWLRFVPEYSLPRTPQPEDRPFGLELNKAKWEPEVADAFEEMCADISGTHDDCRQRGVAYAAAVIPAPASLREDMWNKAVGRYPADFYVKDKDVAATEAALARVGIPTIPLLEPLRAANKHLETHYPLDGHFNPQGAAVVAGAIRTFLISQCLAERCTMRGQMPCQQAGKEESSGRCPQHIQ